jgi:hypothetical protein
VGDQVLAIDGTDLSALDVLAGDAMLNGTVGVTHRIRFGRTQSAALANTETDILIEDLVPVN